MYLPLLARLSGERRACVYFETRHITPTLCLKVPDWKQTVEAVEEMSNRHRIPQFCVMGHSFGSIVAGWVAKELPSRVHKLVLIDPACLLLG